MWCQFLRSHKLPANSKGVHCSSLSPYPEQIIGKLKTPASVTYWPLKRRQNTLIPDATKYTRTVSLRKKIKTFMHFAPKTTANLNFIYIVVTHMYDTGSIVGINEMLARPQSVGVMNAMSH